MVNPGRPFFETLSRLHLESVITVTGKVTLRDPDTVNPAMETGEVELVAETCELESVADPLPLYLAGEEEAGEEPRLKYRYLDLRRERVHRNIPLRSQVISHLRRQMEALGFNEFQTPILTASSPEGARLPRAEPRPPRQVLCVAAGAPDVQAAPDGGFY